VAIIGAGPIGLMFVLALRARYGQTIRILSLDHHDDRLVLAEALGADVVLNTHSGLGRDQVKKVLGLERPDVVVEAVGSEQAHQEAFDLSARGGVLVSFGGVAQGTVLPLDLHRLHYEEVQIVPIYHHTPTDFADAVRAIVSREVPVGPLITARLPLSELQMALEMAQERTTLRTILLPQ
jgi:L-iditol 2-dehydrogenase